MKPNKNKLLQKYLKKHPDAKLSDFAEYYQNCMERHAEAKARLLQEKKDAIQTWINNLPNRFFKLGPYRYFNVTVEKDYWGSIKCSVQLIMINENDHGLMNHWTSLFGISSIIEDNPWGYKPSYTSFISTGEFAKEITKEQYMAVQACYNELVSSHKIIYNNFLKQISNGKN